MKDKLTRREFLVGSSSFAAGAAVGSVLGGGIFNLMTAKAAETPEWPWPYAKLDPERAKKDGYEL
ncbi:MAG: hypothetical protein H0Z38_07490 [Firmicutes bacterium]|nr:hypothetical protein [Bacillota bacterium]